MRGTFNKSGHILTASQRSALRAPREMAVCLRKSPEECIKAMVEMRKQGRTPCFPIHDVLWLLKGDDASKIASFAAVAKLSDKRKNLLLKFGSFEPIRAASHEISWLRPAIAHRTECAICYCDEIEGLRPGCGGFR